jgi:hypothetical protein
MAAATSACDGDGGTPGNRLAPGDVAGVYLVCELKFSPLQTALPTADLLAAVVEMSPPPPKGAPSLTLSPQAAAYQLLYTRKSDLITANLQGGTTFGDAEVFVQFYSGDEPPAAARELLLPPTLSLDFQAEPRRLTATANAVGYQVRRADYARAAGISEEGLQDRINGRLQATLRTGACS